MRLALAIIVISLGFAAPLRAQEIALVLNPPESDFATRIEGQAADLPWRIRTETSDDTHSDGLVRAFARGRELEAHLVVWLETRPHELRVFVGDIRSERVFSRVFDDAEAEAGGSSALLEAAALVVRSALDSLAQGGEIGVALPSRESVQWRIAVRATTTLDGIAPRGNLGPGLGAAVVFGAFEIWIEARTSGDETFQSERVELELWRFGAQLRANWTIVRAPIEPRSEWELAVGAALGAGAYTRITRNVEAGLMALGSTSSPHFAFAIGTRLRWWLDKGPFGLELGAGVETVLPTPSWRIEGAEELATPWPVQPRIEFGLISREW